MSIPFNHPFVMTVTGPTQSGKTYLIAQIIKIADELILPPPTKLMYAYSCWQPLYDEIKKHIDENKGSSSLQSYEFIDCSKRLPRIEDIKSGRENVLFVMDDLMVDTASNKASLEMLNQLVVRDSHHSNMSVIYVCQNLYYGEGKLRTVKQNSKYQIVFNNFADVRNLEMVCQNRKISIEKTKLLTEKMRVRSLRVCFI